MTSKPIPQRNHIKIYHYPNKISKINQYIFSLLFLKLQGQKIITTLQYMIQDFQHKICVISSSHVRQNQTKKYYTYKSFSIT